MSAPIDSIVELASRLVATPSCAGIDPPQPVLSLVQSWLAENGLAPRLLDDPSGKPVAVLVEIAGAAPGPVLCLDACIDTAPAGDPGQWSAPPFSGAVRDGRLLGRAPPIPRRASPSSPMSRAICQKRPAARRAARAVRCRRAHRPLRRRARLSRCRGRPPDAASLGYPGNAGVVAGSRGFLRARLRFSGVAAHSGDSERRGVNALTKAAAFTLKLAEPVFPDVPDAAFPFGPAATVTHIEGGEGFSVVPDLAVCHVDIRLTRTFDAAAATRWLEGIVRAVDAKPASKSSNSWPAYVVPRDDRLVQSFTEAAGAAFGRPFTADVCGPSNIGNLLAARGVPTVCAPGVSFGNMHAADEWADIGSIGPVYAMYCEAALGFLSRP